MGRKLCGLMIKTTCMFREKLLQPMVAHKENGPTDSRSAICHLDTRRALVFLACPCYRGRPRSAYEGPALVGSWNDGMSAEARRRKSIMYHIERQDGPWLGNIFAGRDAISRERRLAVDPEMRGKRLILPAPALAWRVMARPRPRSCGECSRQPLGVARFTWLAAED
jgi:hypothetical protein